MRLRIAVVQHSRRSLRMLGCKILKPTSWGLMLSSYEDGAAAYNRADYATAMRLWLPLAEGGNADAQTMLGVIYEEGQGVSQDDAAAVIWYRRAADQGHPDAQFYLACMHDLGKGVPIDPAAAANWLSKAADQGQTDAQ